ncbi:MAG TPA: PQQ-dependent sugar dehydrogenase [Gammaproteobacteria bacterium]|nr:PQQ-dependent sugar dehydrogenase [Gammaproteobacteria bacterium]
MKHGRVFILLLITALLTWGLRLDAAYLGSTHCDQDLGGITLARGFCATVFADQLGVARHMAVDAAGNLYVALEERANGAGIVALRDSDGRGHADQIKYFGDQGGSGIALHGGYLYFATPTTVVRYALKPGELAPSSAPQTVVSGFPDQNQHAAKSIAIDDQGHLYVNVGAPSNACQFDDRAAGSPGKMPCPLLANHGGIWRFDADRPGQTFPRDGTRYATGIRNAVAVTWNSAVGALYALQMGRDQLSDNWHKLYTDEQSAELPAEEFLRVSQGDDFGWPYCYYDQFQKSRVQAPEYGGDGQKRGDCGKYVQPIAAFPGHWAPESVLFYAGDRFPAGYRGGAFITFHGSWNRAPLPQAGYKVVFLPFKDGKPSAPYQIFADGFAGSDKLVSPGDANFRPMGLAEGPDGALYIGDTQRGRIWRVIYTGP